MSSFWEISDKGFLPAEYAVLPDSGRNTAFSTNLPLFVKERRIREEAVYFSRIGVRYEAAEAVRNKNEPLIEGYMRLYSYMASAYVHAPGENKPVALPLDIAQPLWELADAVGRRPILSYASYCLCNWEKIDPAGPIELGNIRIKQHFAYPGEGQQDEAWFILVHVDIEARAAKAVSAILQSLDALPGTGDLPAIERQLVDINESLTAMNKTLDRMPEECSPNVYFKKVRPYIFGFENLIYRGVSDAPHSYRGETGAQSSIIPAVQTALGVKHAKSELTTHLKVMREYMPLAHQEYLTRLDDYAASGQPGFREYAQQHAHLRDIYNACLNQFITFRKTHLRYAVEYIQRKAIGAKGTGGTPYIPWLTQLATESESYLL